MFWRKLDEALLNLRNFYTSLKREIEYHTELKIALVITILFLVISAIYTFEDQNSKKVVYERPKKVQALPEKSILSKSLKNNKTTETTAIVVYITGAVERPGVYKLKPNSRLFDVVSLAKPLPNAALSFINLAEPLLDGEMIYVPTLVEAQEFGLKNEILEKTASKLLQGIALPTGKKNNYFSGKIDINTASEDELVKIPGIGPKTAQKIIDYRNRKGRINNLEDLLEIPGVGKKTIEKIKEYVVF